MFIHGTPYKLSVGDVLVPGVDLGVSTNGGKSDHVYLLHAMNGVYSMSELDDDYGMNCIAEVCMEEAKRWAGVNGYIYEVQPLSDVEFDDHHDVPPMSMKTKRARIVRILEDL